VSNFFVPQKFFNTLLWKIQLVVALFICLILGASMVLPWFYQFNALDNLNPFNPAGVVELTAFKSGFAPFVFVSILALLAWVGLSFNKPSRIGSVVVAWFGSWWLLLALAAMTSRQQFLAAISKYFEIPNIYFGRKIFDLLETSNLGYGPTNEVGSAWFVVGFAGFLMIVSSVYIIREANRLS
jgi:hypothetical protein